MNGAILITSYLEQRLVEQIATAWDGDVLYDDRLVPQPQYVADHGGRRPELGTAQLERWQAWLGRAEICFDFDWWQPERMPANCPRLRWVQATSAGIGGFVRRHQLDASDIVFTTAAGTHAVPLSEFALTGALYLVKGVPDLVDRQRSHHWERFTTRLLAGRRVTVVGLGSIGRQTARAFVALGCPVTGVVRPGGNRPRLAGVDLADTGSLDTVLARTDILVLATPLTSDTTGLIGAAQFDRLPDSAMLINIARGQVVDQNALVGALQSGRLAGAALDVTDPEPLPLDSPLWDLPNVLISPHSASTVETENEFIVDLFAENLTRYRKGEPLVNRYDAGLGY